MAERTPFEAILFALSKAEMSKSRISEVAGIPWGACGHALEVLTLEGKVVKRALRYAITDKGRKALMGR